MKHLRNITFGQPIALSQSINLTILIPHKHQQKQPNTSSNLSSSNPISLTIPSISSTPTCARNARSPPSTPSPPSMRPCPRNSHTHTSPPSPPPRLIGLAHLEDTLSASLSIDSAPADLLPRLSLPESTCRSPLAGPHPPLQQTAQSQRALLCLGTSSHRQPALQIRIPRLRLVEVVSVVRRPRHPPALHRAQLSAAVLTG